MCCLLLLPIFAACKDNDSGNKETVKNIVCGFESVEEIATLNSGNNFGKKVYSGNTTYVTEGKGCMYMEIDSDFIFAARENIWGIDTQSEFIEPHLKFESSKFDLKDVDGVYGFAIDIYNAGEKDIPVKLTMEGDVDGAGSFFDMGSQTAIKGKSSTLYFISDAETLLYKGIKDVTSIVIVFPFTEGDETLSKLYIDNFRMLRGDNGKTSDYVYNGTTLCDFENEDVIKRISVSSFYTVKDYWPKPTINFNSDYVTKGNASLRLTRCFSNYITKGIGGKSAITLSNGNFFKNTTICNLSEQEIAKTVIKVDVYNDAPYTENIEYFIGPRIKENLCMFRITSVQPRVWITLELSVGQILEEYVANGRQTIDLRELFMDFAFHLSFTENNTNNVINTYVDNLRYEIA